MLVEDIGIESCCESRTVFGITAQPRLIVFIRRYFDRKGQTSSDNGVRTYRIPGGAQSRKGASRMEGPVFRVCVSLRVLGTTDH